MPQLFIVRSLTAVGDEELLAVTTLRLPELSFAKFTTSAATAEITRTFESSNLKLSIHSTQNSDLNWLSDRAKPSLNTSIYNSKKLTDEEIYFRENANIATLSLSNTGITAKAMKQINSVKKLQNLTIVNSPIDDESLKHLSDLHELVSLRLQGTKVTGEGMATLKKNLQNLRVMVQTATPKKPAK